MVICPECMNTHVVDDEMALLVVEVLGKIRCPYCQNKVAPLILEESV